MAKRTSSCRGDFAKEIDFALDRVTRTQQVRDYVGASIIGNNCDRALFYTKEMVAGLVPESRVLRIFSFGDAIETLAVQWLRDAGYYVYDRDPRTGGQFKVVNATREVQGHTDGIIANYPLTPDLFEESLFVAMEQNDVPRIVMGLEIKSHKDARFQDVVDVGVELSKFEHWAQMQTYMHDSHLMVSAFGMDEPLRFFLYVAVNKDTCEIYMEVVPYDEKTAIRLAHRAGRIYRAKNPPPRVAEAQDKSPCKWCDYKVHCYADNRKVELPVRAPHAGGRGAGDAGTLPAVQSVRGAQRQLPDHADWVPPESRGGPAWRN